MGWSIGGMDFSVLFGPAITSKMLKYVSGVILAALFCMLGAILQGANGIETIGQLTHQTFETAVISSCCAAVVIIALNFLKLPVPTSQAVVGSIVGVGLMMSGLNTKPFVKIVLCWAAAPFFAFLVSIPLYLIVGKIYNKMNLNIFQRDAFLRTGLILGGCYASYALGANGVANVAGVFAKSGSISSFAAAVIGGISIALGMATFSRRVVKTIGSGIIKLNAYSALIAVFCEAVTAHFFAVIGVPVSMTQALVGAILGIGFLRDYRTIRIRKVGQIFLGWVFAPIAAGIVSATVYYIITINK